MIDDSFEERSVTRSSNQMAGEGTIALVKASVSTSGNTRRGVRIGCEKPPVGGVDTDYATLKVVGPECFYQACVLQCEGGMAVGSGSQYFPWSRGRRATWPR